MLRKNRKQLSLCVITFNAEKTLFNCMQNVKDVADEIIVVDTGSTDHTVELAEQLGANVYTKQWNYDNSAVKNYAIEKATGKWILFINTDETIDKEDVEKIPDLLKNPMVEGYLFYIQTFIPSLKAYLKTQALRLFRNREEYRYQHKVFERIPDELINSVQDADIIVHHRPNPNQFLKREEQKKQMLEQELKEYPEDSYLHYVYGVSLINRKNIPLSIIHLKKALQYVNHNQIFASHLYKILTWALIKDKEYHQAIQISSQGLHHYPFYTDLVYMRGKAYHQIRAYRQAISDFERCLQLGDAPSSMVSEEGLGSNQALYALGEVHEELLNVEKALSYYKQSYQSNNQFAEALYQIGRLCTQHEKLGEIDVVLQDVLDKEHPDELMTLIDILTIEKKYAKALGYIEKMIEITGINQDILFVSGICHMMLGNHETAEKNFSQISDGHPYSDHVLLRRIQNFWFQQNWQGASILIKKVNSSQRLNPSTKLVYTTLQSIFTNNYLKLSDLDLEGYNTLAKIIEYLLLMNMDVIQNKILDWLLQSKEGKLIIPIGEIFAKQRKINAVMYMLEKWKDKESKVNFIEQTSKWFYQQGQMKEAVTLLQSIQEESLGVLGHYLLYRTKLYLSLDVIKAGIRSKKVEKEMKKQLVSMMELILNEY